MFKMPKKKSKLATPDWILEGFDSEDEYNKSKGVKLEKKSGKTFKLKVCPKCGSDEVGVVVGKEKVGEWECRKCGWTGENPEQKELTENEFMKYLDERGEECC